MVTCRACLLTSDSEFYIPASFMKNLFDHAYSEITYKEMYEFCTDIDVARCSDIDTDQNLPTLICETCEKNLIMAFEFRKKCIISENILQSKLLPKAGAEDQQYHESEMKSEEEASEVEFHLIDYKYSDEELHPSDNENISNDMNQSSIYETNDDELNEDQLDEDQLDEDEIEDNEINVDQLDDDQIDEDEIDDNEINDTDFEQSTIKEETTFNADSNSRKTTGKLRKRKNYPADYVCPVCGKLIQYNVKYHIKTHENIPYEERPFVCEVCNKRFLHRAHLKGHMNTHVKVLKYKCPHCDLKFLAWISRRAHIAKVHTGEYRFECSYCQKQFWTKHQYQGHMRSHTGEKKERTMKCTICDHMVRDKRNLREHMLVHSEERNAKCPECDKSYKSKKNLIVHIKNHHPGVLFPKKDDDS